MSHNEGMETTTAPTALLAAEAIAVEGIDAYFPNVDIDIDPGTAARTLAAYLDANPDGWTPAGEDYGWEFHGDLDALAASI